MGGEAVNTRERHQRREAKAARRRKRTAGPTRGKVRGPVTRAKRRAALMNEGERRILLIGQGIRQQLEARGVAVRRGAKR